MPTSRTGVSIANMQRELEIKNYKPVWVMAHKIRKAMADRKVHYKLVGPFGVGGSFCEPYTSHIPSCGPEHKSKLIIDVSVLKDDEQEGLILEMA